jgi:hypothetical protein
MVASQQLIIIIYLFVVHEVQYSYNLTTRFFCNSVKSMLVTETKQ